MIKILLGIFSVFIAGVIALGSTIAYVEAKFSTNERVNYIEKDAEETKVDIREMKTKLDKIYICLLTKDCTP